MKWDEPHLFEPTRVSLEQLLDWYRLLKAGDTEELRILMERQIDGRGV